MTSPTLLDEETEVQLEASGDVSDITQRSHNQYIFSQIGFSTDPLRRQYF